MRSGHEVNARGATGGTRERLARTVFTDGRYPSFFRPDDGANVFHRLYAAKRDDVLRIVGAVPRGRILDLGGGMGRISVPLARTHSVTLGDIATEMLSRAASAAAAAGVTGEALTLVQVDATSPLPFASASFDVTLAIDLMVHLPDPVAMLRELRRVLAPGGQLLVDTTNRHPQWMLRYPGHVGRHPQAWIRTWRAGGVLPVSSLRSGSPKTKGRLSSGRLVPSWARRRSSWARVRGHSSGSTPVLTGPASSGFLTDSRRSDQP
jgi:2-polyprenyl-3-methyl-5-hydroxy-6-metoxy-1,4-benzoquinol methylase